MTKAGDYRQLIQSFLDRRITAAEFEEGFLSSFKSEPNGMSHSLFLLLDKLFSDVDAFCADEELREDDDLDEDQLREACAEALAALSKM